MASKTSKGSLAGGRVKFRVIEFELEGSDESLHDGLKNLAAALLRTSGAPPSRQLGNSARVTNGAEAPQEELDEEAEEKVVDAEEEPVARRASTSSRKPAQVQILEGINFEDVSPTLKEFYNGKKPSNVLDKYLVIAYWYKHHRKVSDLTVDHFHTALRYMDQATPKDAMQPVRDLRHRKRGKFSGGKTPGTATINHVGENAVRELGQ